VFSSLMACHGIFQNIFFRSLSFCSDGSSSSSTPKSARGLCLSLWAMHLGTLVVVTDTDGTLLAETLAPEATEVNVGLGELGVSEQEPGTENGLGKDVEDGVGNDLLVNVHDARTIGDTPDTK